MLQLSTRWAKWVNRLTQWANRLTAWLTLGAIRPLRQLLERAIIVEDEEIISQRQSVEVFLRRVISGLYDARF
jgi:hypothetical protein